MQINKQSIFELHDLNIRRDRNHFIIEDKITNEFFEMPEVCVDAIHLINEGNNLSKIEEILVKKYPEEEIDVIDFANQLVELDLVHSVDGVALLKKRNEASSKQGFQWISPRVAKVFFNKHTRVFFPILFTVNIIIFLCNPSLFPHYRDLFIFDLMMLNIITYAASTLILVIVHEFGHIIAIRSFNLPTKLQVGNRLFFIVLETDLTQGWKLSTKDRNTLFLAGIYFDSIILFLALVISWINPFTLKFLNGLMGVFIFDIVIRLIYQCCVYMKTDLYYVFENNTGFYNLMENGKEYLKGILRSNKSNQISYGKKEQIVTKYYSFFYIIGVILTCVLFGFYFLPQIIYIFIDVLPGFNQSILDIRFWDAIVFSLQFVVMLGVLSYTIGKKYLLRSPD